MQPHLPFPRTPTRHVEEQWNSLAIRAKICGFPTLQTNYNSVLQAHLAVFSRWKILDEQKSLNETINCQLLYTGTAVHGGLTLTAKQLDEKSHASSSVSLLPVAVDHQYCQIYWIISQHMYIIAQHNPAFSEVIKLYSVYTVCKMCHFTCVTVS